MGRFGMRSGACAVEGPGLPLRRYLAALVLAFGLALGGMAHAADCGLPLLADASTPADVTFTFDGKFGRPGDDREDRLKESEEISGLACAGVRSNGTRRCVLAADGVRYARIIRLKGEELGLRGIRQLVPKRIDGKKVKQADVEGVAFGAQAGKSYFYVTGSHGASRHDTASEPPEYQPARYRVFRLPYDPRTGGIGAAEDSTKLESIILSFGALAGTACHSAGSCTALDRGGTNIEGLAAKGGDLYFGFRSPTKDGKAHVLKVAADRLFGGSDAAPELKTVALGTACGVRDLASVENGFLILAGPDPSEEKGLAYGSYIHFWDGEADTTRLLGSLSGSDAAGKPEGLLVLGEAQGRYKVLVLHDSIAGGKPTEYDLPQP